ncbi:MAG: ABC transporter ATP-binding protein, partial [Spirochaetaceae bacterium]
MNTLRQKNAALHLMPAVRLVWQSAPRLMIVSAIVVALQAVMPLVPLYLVRSIVNAIADGMQRSYVLTLVGAAGAATMITMALRAAAAYAGEAQAHSLSDYVQSLIHRKSLEVDLEYYDRPGFFDKLHRAQEEAPYRPAAVVDNIMVLLRTSISLAGIIGLMIYVLPWYTVLVLVAASGPLGIVRSVASRRQFRWSMAHTAAERSVLYLNWLLTGKSHAKELRLFGLSPLLAQRSAASRARLRRERLSLSAQRSRGEVLAYVLQTAAVFTVVGLVTAQALRG